MRNRQERLEFICILAAALRVVKVLMLLSTLLLSIVGGLLFTTRATFADDSHKVYEDCNGHVAFVSTGDLSRKWLGDWIIAPKVIPEKPTVLNVRLVEHKQSAWHGEQDIFHAKPVSHKDPKMIRIRLDYLALPYGYKLIISNAEYHLDPSFIVYDGYRKDIELTIATSRVRVQLLQTKYNPYNPKAYVYLRYSCIHSDHPDTLENYLPLTKCASVRWKGYMLLRELQCRPRFYGPINEVQCIWQDQICDGVKNCATGEDEEFCDPKRFNLLQGASLISLKDQTQLTDGHCEEGFFRCNVDDEPEEKSYCITNDWVCDGHNDCPGKRDEEREHCKIEPENDKCPKNTYFCSEDSVCLKMGVVCDKNVDCKGGIDESEEACTWRAERANKNLHTYNGTSDKSHLNRRRRSVAESVPVNVQDNSTDELADPMAILYLNKTQPVCNGIAVSQNVTSVWILFTNECKDEWNLENLTIQLGNNSELYE